MPDLSVADVHAFVTDAKKSRDTWFTIAERSWRELKKRQKNGQLWSITPNSSRKRSRYPAWYSIHKIRQPLLLSRLGIPVCKDTTQSGTDSIGATAAILRERLAVNLARNQEDFFDVCAACRDDFLATNFSIARCYYECKEVKTLITKRLTPQKFGADVVFIDEKGKIIESDNIQQDDQGFFLETSDVTDVTEEQICLENVPYRGVYIDPTAKNWKKVRKLAIECEYSERDFRLTFGQDAVETVPLDKRLPGDQNMMKYIVYEYWDFYDKEVYWLAENGTDFIKPIGYEPLDEQPELNGPYNLTGFFPFVKPLIINNAPDEFWPVPEYYQLGEILEDIHTIFSRMIVATRAFRTRLLFDNNVDGLEAAIKEANESDAFGVANLTQALKSAGGNLGNVAQYLPVDQIITGLEQLGVQLENRLKWLFNLTGTNDLLQGLSNDASGKTLGERQMEEKYAINQIADAQRKMQEFMRDAYELITEMALKNFKDETLAKYIMPETLEPQHQQQYGQALNLLKSDPKRFRTDLETDSTIAINEQYDKAMRVELVNTLTQALEKTASTAESSPALVEIELHAMKYLIQGMRQGKMFQAEITEAIDNVIEQIKSAPQPFNKDEAAANLASQKLQADSQFKILKIQSEEKIAAWKMQNEALITANTNRIEQLRLFLEQNEAGAANELEYQKLSAHVAEIQGKLQVARDELVAQMRQFASEQEAQNYRASIEQQFRPFELQLEQQRAQLDAAELALQQQSQTFQAQNTMIDNVRQRDRLLLDKKALEHEVSKPPEIPPITVNVEQPKSKKTKVKTKGGSFEQTVKQ